MQALIRMRANFLEADKQVWLVRTRKARTQRTQRYWLTVRIRFRCQKGSSYSYESNLSKPVNNS